MKPSASVVDEDVELAEVRGRAGYAAGDLIEVGDIHLQRKGAAAHGLDFACEIATGGDVAQAKRDVGSGMSECEGDGATEAACGAGDQGDLPGEVKFGKIIHRDCFALQDRVR